MSYPRSQTVSDPPLISCELGSVALDERPLAHQGELPQPLQPLQGAGSQVVLSNDLPGLGPFALCERACRRRPVTRP